MRSIFTLIMIALATLPALAADTPVYQVGPEDVIGVVVARHPEFSGDYTIPVDGTLTLPGAGRITAAGKTLAEISGEVTDRLSERIKAPEVTVSLRTARMQRVYVLGAVHTSGLYDLKPGWRITEALAAAGGIAGGIETSDCSACILRASTGKRETYRLADILRGQSSADTLLQTGDVVTIDADETVPVYVTGRVKNPGIYRLRKDSAGVVEAITLAGGALEDAALGKVTVAHIDGKNETVNAAGAILDGGPAPKVEIKAADMITVPAETSRIAVLGNVSQPGFFPIRENQKLTLTDAIGLARGADPRTGKLSEIAVVRTDNGKQQRLVFDLSKFLKTGDASQNPELKAGDVIFVPRSNKINWDSIMGSLPLVGLFTN